MKQGNQQSAIILALMGSVVVIWFGLLIAPRIDDGLVAVLILVSEIGATGDYTVKWCEDSLKAVLFCLAVYGIAVLMFFTDQKHYRRGEEHGSAKWGNIKWICWKYARRKFEGTRLLTMGVRMRLNSRSHGRNSNVIVCGGSGAGKTRGYALPNAMQANSSYVILDPKGEILRKLGRFYKRKGYRIKILDLINMEKSHCYNPFVYLRTDDDVQKLVTNLFKATTPKGTQSSDPFWESAASMLLMALVFYLRYEAPEEEQNFSMVMEMLRAGAIEDEEENPFSPLDRLFAELEMDQPDHIALKYYRNYHSGSAKTLKSVQITLAAHLEKFNLDSLAMLTNTDELELDSLGEVKTVLFALIPDNDTSFNFVVSMLYVQLYQQLFYKADRCYGGSLPIPVHFLMDEFPNVAVPDDFDKILSVMRSRNVSVSIILQNMSQLKALFEKQWESITGNCDVLLYLGGNEQSTHKYVSELLGKATIDANSYGKSKGRNGSYSTNYQILGRELMTPDEVRMLDNHYAILFIRGERPIIDRKFVLSEHPEYDQIDDNGSGYEHGRVTMSTATIEVSRFLETAEQIAGEATATHRLISSEELERKYGGKQNEKRKERSKKE